MSQRKHEHTAGGLVRHSRVRLMLLAAALAASALAFASRIEPAARVHAASTSSRAATVEHAPQEHWSIAGHVHNERGDAVARARVCAVRAVGDAAQQPPICTYSEASGAYALELSALTPVTITASAAGYAWGHARSGLPIQARDTSRADADIVLRGDGARVAGRVADALGNPVSNARVQLFRMLGALQTSIEVHADEQGKFEVWAPPGGLTLRSEASGYAPTSRWVVAPSQRVALQLTPASAISGRVLDASSGKPVAGVEVRALLEGKRARSTAAVSGSDGQFTLGGLDAGRYVITAEHERFRARDALALQVGLAETKTSLLVSVQPAVSVLGKVVSSHGEACAGGRVSLEPVQLSQPSAESAMFAHVELDGTVRLRGLAPGRYRVNVRCAEAVLAQGPTQLDVQDQDVQATWRVEPGIGLDIAVLDAADKPVPRAAVLLRRALTDQPKKGVITPLTADDAGHATIGKHLLPGTYTVKPSGGLQGEPVTVDLHADAGRVQVTLRLRGSAWIDVDVQDSHGQPVDDLRVIARAALQDDPARAALVPARPQGAGAYRIGPLAPGRYFLSAADGVNRSWGDTTEQAAVTVAENAAVRRTIVVERDARVAGLVLDAQGEPAANVWVSIKDQAAESDPSRVPTFAAVPRRLTDAAGRFEIDGISPHGRFVVSVSDSAAGQGAAYNVQPGSSVRVALTYPTPIASSAGDR